MGGMDMMVERVFKNMLEKLPPDVLDKIVTIWKKVVGADTKLDIILQNQARIEGKLDHLILKIAGVTPDTTQIQKELTDGRTTGRDQPPAGTT